MQYGSSYDSSENFPNPNWPYPWVLVDEYQRQALYSISASLSISSVAILTAKRATIRQSDVDDWLKLDIQRRHSFASTPEGPRVAPVSFHSSPTNGSCLYCVEDYRMVRQIVSGTCNYVGIVAAFSWCVYPSRNRKQFCCQFFLILIILRFFIVVKTP